MRSAHWGLHMLKRVQAIGYPSWVGSIGLTIAVAVTYFLAARLSLALLTEPDGVAVFWPAAGIASGLLIALGPGARLPVAVGVMAATVTANLLGDRNVGSAIVFALCNAGEAMIIAWLIEYHFGSVFSLDSSRRVLGLFLATAVGTAISGIGGTAGFILFHGSDAPILTTWLNWVASDAIGVVTVAPLVIGLARTLHDLPEISELVQGTLALVVLALASAIGFGAPTDYWFTILPLTLLFPLLLWPAAHCRPVFAAAATFILALAIVWTITFGIGRLGDPSIRLADRVHAAEAALLAISACALVLAALFAERRRNEAALKDSNDRLQLALDGAELGIWSLQLKTGRFENDVRDRRIHGHGTEAPPQTLAEMRSQVHPDDLSNLDAAFAALGRAGGSCRTEYRLAPRTDQERSGRERWVAIEGAVVRQADGRPVQLLGVTRDITERKQAEQALAERDGNLASARGAARCGIYVDGCGSGENTYCKAKRAIDDLWGVTPRRDQDRWCDLARYYHPDDQPMAWSDCPTEIALKQGASPCDGPRGNHRAVRSDGTRVPIIPYPYPIRDGDRTRVVGVVNMTVDISERKEAERALAERNLQLALAGKAGLVGSYAYDTDTEMMQVSEGYCGHPRLARGNYRKHAQRVEVPCPPGGSCANGSAPESKLSKSERGEYSVEYRIVRPDGEVRWIESRRFHFIRRRWEPPTGHWRQHRYHRAQAGREHQRVLIAELDHRVKNVLATVSAVAAHTLDASSSMSHFVAALDGRIRSMASTHELLSIRQWQRHTAGRSRPAGARAVRHAATIPRSTGPK